MPTVFIEILFDIIVLLQFFENAFHLLKMVFVSMKMGFFNFRFQFSMPNLVCLRATEYLGSLKTNMFLLEKYKCISDLIQ